MINPDNKTKTVQEFNLNNYKKLIENNPCHIATINDDNTPNLAVASDIKNLNNKIILISNNEMIHTPDNIIRNNNVVMTSFNGKWAGLRITGIINYQTKGQFFDKCNNLFNNDTATPKGAIIIEVTKVESIA